VHKPSCLNLLQSFERSMEIGGTTVLWLASAKNIVKLRSITSFFSYFVLTIFKHIRLLLGNENYFEIQF
jgi:hypothetical protein